MPGHDKSALSHFCIAHAVKLNFSFLSKHASPFPKFFRAVLPKHFPSQ